MTTRSIAVAGLVLLAVTSASEEPARHQLTDLGWMAGTWSSAGDGVHSEELWTEPRGGVMLGLHRDVRPERAVAWEFLRIEERPKGIVYLASPRGVAPTPFDLVELTERRAVFANPAHDFPKRIIYWIGAEGALHARADAGEGTSGPEWSWQRSR